MGERLTDEQLRGLAQLEGNGDAGAMRSMVRELLTLRARVAELEAATADVLAMIAGWRTHEISNPGTAADRYLIYDVEAALQKTIGEEEDTDND